MYLVEAGYYYSLEVLISGNEYFYVGPLPRCYCLFLVKASKPSSESDGGIGR